MLGCLDRIQKGPGSEAVSPDPCNLSPLTRPDAGLNSDTFIQIDHVTFGYDASRTILNDVSLQFARGKVTAILGGSGCGKTTLLRLIGGVYKPQKGRILFDGVEVDTRDREQLYAIRRRLGM